MFHEKHRTRWVIPLKERTTTAGKGDSGAQQHQMMCCVVFSNLRNCVAETLQPRNRFNPDIVNVISGESGDTLVFKNGTRQLLQPCLYEPREDIIDTKPRATPTKPSSPLSSETTAGVGSGYYSGWVAYAVSTEAAGYSAMASAWAVPGKPRSLGPAPPLISSSIYLFNGTY